MRKRSNFEIENEYYFEILRIFLEECLIKRFGKVRILEREWKDFNLVWISMRKRSDFKIRNEYTFEILRSFLEKCLMVPSMVWKRI